MAGIAHRPADIAEFWRRASSGRRQAHYYVALLGWRKYDANYVVDQIRRGFAFASLENFQRNTELPPQVLAKLIGVAPRTLARRKESRRLEPAESDRLARAARVFARALELFEGDAPGALKWLNSRQKALGGRVPFEFATTDSGAIEVDRLVGRLEHGIPT